MSVRMVVLMIMRMAQDTSQSPRQMAMWRRLLAETSTGKKLGQTIDAAEILSLSLAGYSFYSPPGIYRWSTVQKDVVCR